MKKILWLVLPVGAVVLFFCFIAYIWHDYPPHNDGYPQASIKNKFTFYNDGCCFILNDLSISLTDEYGTEYPLFKNDSPPYGKRFDTDFPRDISGAVKAVVAFNYEYDLKSYAEFPVMDFTDVDSLKENGLLLAFGDGDLFVQSGSYEAFFYYNKKPWTDALSVTKYSEMAGKYYEETSNGYKAAIYKKEEIEIERIKNWLATCTPSEEYYQFIYSDPDSWDMYIYYPFDNAGFSKYDFKLNVDGSEVNIFVSENSDSEISTDYILIRIQAPARVGAWPNSSRLYIDGKQITK